jgi:hypothetical protein
MLSLGRKGVIGWQGVPEKKSGALLPAILAESEKIIAPRKRFRLSRAALPGIFNTSPLETCDTCKRKLIGATHCEWIDDQ